jgi:hypothetical protein
MIQALTYVTRELDSDEKCENNINQNKQDQAKSGCIC